MKKVITYGTYDLLHYGHIKLLERAKELGDYLIVGVTSDDFDKNRGKINVQQTLMERIEAVRKTGLADEIVVEEYEGQKIDDIIKYNVDIFTVGSDWLGKFDYLNEYCKVVYLDRTQGVSSSKIRSEEKNIKIGLVGDNAILFKYLKECECVNGLEVGAIYTSISKPEYKDLYVSNYDELLDKVDSVYLITYPRNHYSDIARALNKGKHVLCEAPIALTESETKELFELANSKDLVLMDAIKTAYSTAFNRMCLLIKSGEIGDIISVDASSTSLFEKDLNQKENLNGIWNSMCFWSPTALLPIFKILGSDYKKLSLISLKSKEDDDFDLFTKADFIYDNAVASFKIGRGVKTEGELVITGTKGYVVVPAPWWKTDYFEIRYEDQTENKRYFYQLEGEGIRHQLLSFKNSISNGRVVGMINENYSMNVSKVIEQYYREIDCFKI